MNTKIIKEKTKMLQIPVTEKQFTRTTHES